MTGTAIGFDFQTGKFSNCNIIERTGLELMRLAAKLTGYRKFVGFSYAARAIRIFCPSNRIVEAKMDDDFVFAFPYGDAYWGRLFDNSQYYEEDVRGLLTAISDVDFAFMDCGANYGYHSCFTNSKSGGSRPTIAIEADHQNFEVLRYNRRLNGEQFCVRHNAIHSKSGENVTIYGAKHEAFSMVEQNSIPRGSVNTLAISALATWLAATGKSKVVIKLDVEGVESEAIDGIGPLNGADVLIVYEDHGSDDNHTPTRHLMSLEGYRVFRFKNGKLIEISKPEELEEIKINRRYGYDLIATKSNFWLNKIAALNGNASELSEDSKQVEQSLPLAS